MNFSERKQHVMKGSKKKGFPSGQNLLIFAGQRWSPDETGTG